MRDKVRKHFYFSGDVQMVGFRYQAKYAADASLPASMKPDPYGSQT